MLWDIVEAVVETELVHILRTTEFLGSVGIRSRNKKNIHALPVRLVEIEPFPDTRTTPIAG